MGVLKKTSSRHRDTPLWNQSHRLYSFPPHKEHFLWATKVNLFILGNNYHFRTIQYLLGTCISWVPASPQISYLYFPESSSKHLPHPESLTIFHWCIFWFYLTLESQVLHSANHFPSLETGITIVFTFRKNKRVELIL